MRPRPLELALLLALTLATFATRLCGLDKLQPHLQEADPGMVVQVELIRADIAPDPVEHKAYLAYPTLLASMVAQIPRASVAPDAPAQEQLALHLAAASADVVRMRALIALLSALLVPCTWWLARRFLGPAGALTAAALVAASVLHLLFSQQARPHGAHATAAMLAVLCHMQLLRKPSLANLTLSAFACGFALAILHTGLFTLPPLFVAWWLSKERGRPNPWWAALALLPSAAAVACFYPRAPRLEGEGSIIEFGGHTLRFEKLDGTGFLSMFELLRGYEPALLAASSLGIALALYLWLRKPRGARRPSDDALVGAAYALPYFLALGVFGETFDRFLLPLLPFLACFAGLVVDEATQLAARRSGSSNSPKLAGLGAAALVLAHPVYEAARYLRVRSAPDTFELAATWVRANLAPSDGVLLGPRLTLPLFHDQRALDFAAGDRATRLRPWIRHQLEDPAPDSAQRFALFVAPGAPPKLTHLDGEEARRKVDELLALAHARYVVVEVSRLMSNFPGVRALRETARERGELVATFRGEGETDCDELPLDYQDVPRFAQRIAHASAFGPCLEVYRLRER